MKYIWEGDDIGAGMRVRCYSVNYIIGYDGDDKKFYITNLESGALHGPYTKFELADFFTQRNGEPLNR